MHSHDGGAGKGRRLVDFTVFLNEVWRPMTRKVTGGELKQALKEGQLPPARVSRSLWLLARPYVLLRAARVRHYG